MPMKRAGILSLTLFLSMVLVIDIQYGLSWFSTFFEYITVVSNSLITLHHYNGSSVTGTVTHSPLPVPPTALLTLYNIIPPYHLDPLLKLPWYANYWSQSCEPLHPYIDCIIILLIRDDLTVPPANDPGWDTLHPLPNPHVYFNYRLPTDTLPSNVRIYPIPLAKFSARLKNITGQSMVTEYNRWDKRKLADFKPFFGSIFQDILTDYRYWGWIELDMVLGNIPVYLHYIFQGFVPFQNNSESTPTTFLPSSSSSLRILPRYPFYLRNDNKYSSYQPFPDIVTFYNENGWGEMTTAGQFTILRNIPSVNTAWRWIYRDTLNNIVTTNKHTNADERIFGGTLYDLIKTNGTVWITDDNENDGMQLRVRRPLRFTAVRAGFGDHDLCVGPGSMGWTYYWEDGRVLRKRGCKEYAEIEEGLYYHYGCVKNRKMTVPSVLPNRTEEMVWHTKRWLLQFELKDTDGFYRKNENPLDEC